MYICFEQMYMFFCVPNGDKRQKDVQYFRLKKRGYPLKTAKKIVYSSNSPADAGDILIGFPVPIPLP